MKNRLREFVAWLRVCPLWERNRKTQVELVWDSIDDFSMTCHHGFGLAYDALNTAEDVTIVFKVTPFGAQRETKSPVVRVLFPPENK